MRILQFVPNYVNVAHVTMNNRIWRIKFWIILTIVSHIDIATPWPNLFTGQPESVPQKNEPTVPRTMSSRLREQQRLLNKVERVFHDIENNYVSINLMPNFVICTKRRVMLQWRVLEVKPGDWIGVYNKDPTAELPIPKPKYWYYIPNQTGKVGYVETTAFVDLIDLMKLCEPNYLDNSVCYNSMYVAYHQDDTIIATNCLKTDPVWMSELPADVKSMALSKIFIPGTHDSGAYDTYIDPFFMNITYLKYVYTQDNSILGQLCYGARYLDLRVGYYTGNDSQFTRNRSVWWLYHGIVRIRPLRFILRDIKQFIEHTNEVVIIEFHKFEKGFNILKRHNQFYKFCETVLGKNNIADNTRWNKSLKDLQDEGRRIVIIYNYLPAPESKPLVLGPIHRYWPNAPNLSCFKKYGVYYLKSVQNHRNSKNPTLFMAEFTPRVVGVISTLSSGVRHNSKTVNPTVNNWLAMPEWGTKINMIAVDFLLSTNIVDAAIHWNKNRSSSTEQVNYDAYFLDDAMEDQEGKEPEEYSMPFSSMTKPVYNQLTKEQATKMNEEDYQYRIAFLIQQENQLAKLKKLHNIRAKITKEEWQKPEPTENTSTLKEERENIKPETEIIDPETEIIKPETEITDFPITETKELVTAETEFMDFNILGQESNATENDIEKEPTESELTEFTILGPNTEEPNV